jgi:hypothetical protein
MSVLGTLGALFMKKGALTGLGSIATQGAFSLGSDMLTNRGAMRRQRLSDANNIRLWQMQNEYNTPANQMKRLQEAGLNPNLIYGSGSANTGVAGSIAPSKAAPYNVKNPVPLQSMLLGSQIDNINADTERKKADTENTRSLMPGRIAKLGYDATISEINSLNLDEMQKEKIKGLVSDAVTKKYLKDEAINRVEFENNLRDMGINPKTGPVQAIIQLIFDWIDKLRNPSEAAGAGAKSYLNKNQSYNR